MKLKKKSNGVLAIILGIAIVIISIVMTVHDADYIFLGNTLDLNSHFAQGGDIPRDDYVTFTVEYTLGNYGESQDYISGFIPVPFSKTQEYALVCDNGLIISTEVKGKKIINALDALDEEGAEPVTITGCFNIIAPDMSRYLKDYLRYYDYESDGLILTDYCIDTTNTRFKLIFMYLLFAIVGVVLTLIGVKDFKNRNN